MSCQAIQNRRKDTSPQNCTPGNGTACVRFREQPLQLVLVWTDRRTDAHMHVCIRPPPPFQASHMFRWAWVSLICPPTEEVSPVAPQKLLDSLRLLLALHLADSLSLPP